MLSIRTNKSWNPSRLLFRSSSVYMSPSSTIKFLRSVRFSWTKTEHSRSLYAFSIFHYRTTVLNIFFFAGYEWITIFVFYCRPHIVPLSELHFWPKTTTFQKGLTMKNIFGQVIFRPVIATIFYYTSDDTVQSTRRTKRKQNHKNQKLLGEKRKLYSWMKEHLKTPNPNILQNFGLHSSHIWTRINSKLFQFEATLFNRLPNINESEKNFKTFYIHLTIKLLWNPKFSIIFRNQYFYAMPLYLSVQLGFLDNWFSIICYRVFFFSLCNF